MQILLKAIGLLLSALGLGVLVFTLLALLNPQDAQLANDGAPFAAPPTSNQLFAQLASSAAVLVAGVWLSFRKRPR